MTYKNKQEVLDHYDINQIEALAFEYGRLMDWFKKDFPEGTMRLEVNSDQRDHKLHYILTVMSGKEMANDQRHMVNKISISRVQFEDHKYMSALQSSIYPQYRKTISHEFNKQYNIEKEKIWTQ